MMSDTGERPRNTHNGDLIMRTRAFLGCVAGLCLAATLGGCKCNKCKECCGECKDQASAAPAGFLNATCPMSGEALTADSAAVSYKDGKVGFCCQGCADKFEKMSDADKANTLAHAK